MLTLPRVIIRDRDMHRTALNYACIYGVFDVLGSMHVMGEKVASEEPTYPKQALK